MTDQLTNPVLNPDDVEALHERAAERQRLCTRIKELLVERLELDMPADWLTDDQPLFGRGLELDSVFALELVLAVEDEFGVMIDDDEVRALASVNGLADFIEADGRESTW